MGRVRVQDVEAHSSKPAESAPAKTEAPKAAENYAFRAVRNRALNFKRGLWRRLAREVESMRWFEREPDETAAERAAMQCLQILPQEQREVIVLKIWSRYTFEEIGGLLELSPLSQHAGEPQKELLDSFHSTYSQELLQQLLESARALPFSALTSAKT